MIRRPPRSTLFPYTTSSDLAQLGLQHLGLALGIECQGRCGLQTGHERNAHDAQGHQHLDQREAACRAPRSEEHTSELQSPCNLVCRLLLEKKIIRTVLSRST